MKTLTLIGRFATLATAAAFISGCSLLEGTQKNVQQQNAASSGPTFSSSVPTADAIAGRIQKGLPSVSPNSGNFKTVLKQIQTNLPDSADPTKASGLDQIPLLVFAACSDVNASSYGVNVNTSVSANSSKLVSAGLTMVNLYVANLAASGSLNQQAQQVFQSLVQNDQSAGASTSQTFVSVCLAANSFGVGMLGF